MDPRSTVTKRRFRPTRLGLRIAGVGIWALLLALFAAPAPAMAQGWVVTGTVTDGAGTGIADVDIDIFVASSGVEISLSSDVTDVDGSFELSIVDAVPSQFYDVVFIPVTGSGFLPSTVSDVFIAGDTDLGTSELEPGWTISGRVIDESGMGIEAIDIEVFVPNGGAPLLLTNDDTDADGFYAVLLPEDTWDIEFRQVLAGSVSYVPVLLEDQPITQDLEFPDVVMRVGRTVTGTVEDSNGDPVVAADIDVLDPVTGDKIQTFSDNTDSGGEFSVLVPVGEWDFEVAPPIGDRLAAVLFRYTVLGAPSSNDTGLTVLPSAVELTGRVENASGTALTGVDIDLADSGTGAAVVTTRDDTDASGNFSVFVVEDTYDIEVRPPFALGYAPRVLTDQLVDGDTDLGDIALSVGRALTGKVTDESGKSVAGVIVTLVDASTGTPMYVFGNQSKIDGSYALRQVSDTYDATFTPPASSGLPAVTVEDVNLTADRTLNVTLTTGGGGGDQFAFLRGDADASGAVSPIADALFLLRYAFAGGTDPKCLDAADVDGNNSLAALSDVLYLLAWGFQGGPAPPTPGTSTCGVDPQGAGDGIPCDATSTNCD